MRRLTSAERAQLRLHIGDLLDDGDVQRMRDFVQHGDTSTFAHAMLVTYVSYLLCVRLGLRADLRQLARGALLHDFYLYDWHDPNRERRLHGFTHPRTALKNAAERFELTSLERQIILCHMWPLTLRHMPTCKESLIVCLADKYCALRETVPTARRFARRILPWR